MHDIITKQELLDVCNVATVITGLCAGNQMQITVQSLIFNSQEF